MSDDDFLSKAKQKRAGFGGELVAWLRHNKKWWLGPILVAVLLLGALVLLGGSGASPFIYTLF